MPDRKGIAVRGLAIAVLVAACAAGCMPPDSMGNIPERVRIIDVGEPRYGGEPGDPLEAACHEWRLSAQQVAEFFRLGQQYEQPPYAGFYQLPCSISGKLRSEGVTWDFTIGGGGTATWSNGGQARHFGCSVEACEPLVLLPADGMDPQ
ncbi:hypothetical protein [Luteimonas lutimaris]|uniref:Uncharacterized protein n=1 Tax=Luteimonas lutimaris TaxID=698645 RepID=A0ABP7M546_9GAMM